MATKSETTTGRTIKAYRVAGDLDNANLSPWTPEKFTSSSAGAPLVMHLGRKEQKRIRTTTQVEKAAFAPEPGQVLIPSGEFLMGQEDSARDEDPQRKVLLDAYWIDRYPVTNTEYKTFVDATGHRTPPNWIEGTYLPERDKHPVTNVSWSDATAFAKWVGKRLPTEAEWEKAARGANGQQYPWGDGFRKDYLNSSNDYGSETTPVDFFPDGASPYGILDMCGNVLEWCSDWYYDDDYKTGSVENLTGPSGGQYKVTRGGFYAENRTGSRCASRHYAPAAVMQDHIGFRCAKTPVKPGEKTSGPAGEFSEAVQKPVPTPKPEKPKPQISEKMPLEEIASEWPETVARVVRTILVEEARERDRLESADNAEPAANTDHRDSRSPCEKVSMLIFGLGQQAGAGIFKYLSDLETEQIVREISEITNFTTQERDQVYNEIKNRVLSGSYILEGGTVVARATLEAAVGPRKAQAMLDRAASATSSGFHLLHDLDPKQIVPFIAKEHPQTVALILSQLDAAQAGGVINGLSNELKSDVVRRIAMLENISPQILRELEENLFSDLQAILTGQIAEIGGPKAAAEILNHTNRSAEEFVLADLEKEDAELAEKVRNQLFVFDDIAHLTDREIQILLKELNLKEDPRDMAVALKGGNQKVIERILSNVPEEQAESIKEAMKFSGPVREDDVEEVQLKIVRKIRDLEEAGEVTVVIGGHPDSFV